MTLSIAEITLSNKAKEEIEMVGKKKNETWLDQ